MPCGALSMALYVQAGTYSLSKPRSCEQNENFGKPQNVNAKNGQEEESLQEPKN